MHCSWADGLKFVCITITVIFGIFIVIKVLYSPSKVLLGRGHEGEALSEHSMLLYPKNPEGLMLMKMNYFRLGLFHWPEETSFLSAFQ